jgi:hypothetical protein
LVDLSAGENIDEITLADTGPTQHIHSATLIGDRAVALQIDFEGRKRPRLQSSASAVTASVLGVLLLSVVTNGLLLIGWNFYWQQVGTGVLIFLVLAVSFLGRRARA